MNLLTLITKPFNYVFGDDKSKSLPSYSIKCKSKSETWDRSYENKLNLEPEKPTLLSQSYNVNICSGVLISPINSFISGVCYTGKINK